MRTQDAGSANRARQDSVMAIYSHGRMKRWHKARYFCTHDFDDTVRMRMSGGKPEQCLVCKRCGQTTPYHGGKHKKRFYDHIIDWLKRRDETKAVATR